jgi:ornithine carbamoyltransferase
MPPSLRGKRVALWFLGQGFRNRMAFEIGARALGADVSFVPGELAVHEPIEDIAHYLGNWFSLLVIRCQSLNQLEQLSGDTRVPVINARTAANHPCEIMGDLQYIRRMRGSLDGLKVAFVGEAANLCTSWFEAARVLPIEVLQIAPRPWLLDPAAVDEHNRKSRGRIAVSEVFEDNINAGIDVLYTDCWPREGDPALIGQSFLPYRISADIVGRINPAGFFLPCPPVSRGRELTAEAAAHPRCCNYRAKEFLLHAQNAIMEHCLA